MPLKRRKALWFGAKIGMQCGSTIQATGHRMAQRLLPVRRQQVVARLVVQAHMHMHAAAGVLQVRLGHETGAVVVLECHAAGAAAEQGGPVGGAQAVVAGGRN